MPRKILTIIGFQLTWLFTIAQSAQIREEPIDIGTNVFQYTASFFFPFSVGWTAPTITWSIQNGTILQQNTTYPGNPISAVVEWWSNQGTSITITAVDYRGLIQTATYTHDYFNFTDCWITPVSQSLYYGQIPILITTDNKCLGGRGDPVTYQWQEFDVDIWKDMNGETNADLQLPAVTSGKERTFRRMTSDGTDVMYSASSTTSLAAFDPGTIYTSTPNPGLYVPLSITATYAGGGECNPNSLIYTWEKCNDFGVWTAIGSTAYAPAISVNGKTKVRRKVQFCNGTIYYSNILEFNPTYTSANNENLNYVRELTSLKKGILNWEDTDFQPIGDKIQSTTYLDGLGRPIQSVEKEVSPVPGYPYVWLDLVKHYDYDAAGRSPKDFIPYPSSEYPGKYKPNASAVQSSVSAFFDNETQSSPTYSTLEFDNSPLNRILKSTSPGASWVNNGVSVSYDFNQATESVQIWTLAYSSSALPVSTQAYSTGQLLKTVTLDEKQKKVITYTDYSGSIILKKVQDKEPGQGLTDQHAGWACTYYVYDDLGLLRYLITPKAVEYLDNNGWSTITQTLIDELCFKYLYDEKDRTILVKKPGVGEEKMVYDNKDRLVLVQHANQDKANNTTLTKNQWIFSLYDDLNRVIANGLLDNDNDRATLQASVNLLANSNITVSAFVGNGTYQSIIVDNPVAGSTGSNGYLTGTTNIVFNSITHYDNYSYSNVKTFTTNYVFAYTPASYNTIEPTVKTVRTNNLITGEKIRILDADNNLFNDVFLFSTAYYDEIERPIQNLVDNIKGGLDYQVNQYDFSGKIMSSYTSHFAGGSITYTTISKNEYDKIGRITKFSKNFNNSFYKLLAEYVYDELGRVKTKRIAPGYTGIPGKTEMESRSYNYNIQGSVTGINKDYVLSDNNYAQWDRFFGMYFTYANHSTPQWNGNISSITWKTQGDNAPRKFDFEYDNLDRFKNALYKQKNKPADANWSSAEVDFSAYVEYEDGNGNIKSMKHMGIIPGVNNGVIIDDLRYSYMPTGINNLNSNKLKQVDDLGSLGGNNGLLGDFKDPNTTQDYYYDVNGNLVKDLNKNIKNTTSNGITYNFMNKPDKIVIEGKSTIEFTYDAFGEKLKKKVTYADGSIRINTYVADFIYEQFIPVGGGGQGDQLQFVLHEEGRLKIITTVSNLNLELNAGSSGITNWTGGKQGVFEYFIKDHLGNTRLVLTEEVQKEFYRATVESAPTSLATDEEKLFGQVNPTTGEPDNNNELRKTRYDNTNPSTSPWPNKTDDYTRLTAAETGKDIGPNLILKVMAGDIINTNVNYYYFANNATGPGLNPVTGLVNSLIGALTSNKANVLSKNQYPVINSSLSGNTPLQNFLNEHNNGTGSPKAFLNIIFFDEQFKFINKDMVTPDVGSGFVQVTAANDPNANMTLQKKAPKNGWVFIYLSNESNETVYFDNFYTAIEHGRISEEAHYYPFGLKIGAISSRAFSKLENKYGYQGDFSEIEEETGWDEFFLRMYDSQIGRWTSADPFDEFASPYVGMGNNPIKNTDPSGGSIGAGGWGAVGGAVLFGVGGFFAAKAFGAKDGSAVAWGLTAAFLGAGVGFGAGESLQNQTGFGVNFRSFYEGFFGGGDGATNPLGKSLRGGVMPPSVWGWLPELKWIPEWGNLPISFSQDFINQFGNELVRQLQIITGLDLRINTQNRMLQYQQTNLVLRKRNANEGVPLIKTTNKNKNGTSGIGRRFLLNTIAQGFMGSLGVGLTTGTSRGFQSTLEMNPSGDIFNAQRSPSLNPLSWGLGMVFLHELGHTRFGGNLTDLSPGQPASITPGQTPGRYTGPGMVERMMINKIRHQLGPNFGRRRTYLEFDKGYIPFDTPSLRALNNGQSPSTGSLWIKF